MNDKLQIQKGFLDDFFNIWKVSDESVELFDCNASLEIKPELRGKKPRYFVGRSDAMTAMISREVQKVTNDFKNKCDQYEGVLYMMHKMTANGDIIPLYIGKAEKLGKTENLSENITKGKGKLGRWGHGYAYHIGDLSAVAYKHDKKGLWKEFGATSLTFLEYLLIGVSTSVYPEVLLNREGQNR